MKNQESPKAATWKRPLLILLWVATAFMLAQLIVVAVLYGLQALGINISAESPSAITFFAAAVYAITLILVIVIPYRFFNRARVSKKTLGIARLPSWLDIALTLPAAFVYLLTTALLVTLVSTLFPAFNPEQVQDIGFTNLTQQSEYLLAFVTLIILAPLAEELLFRGYLYGKLRTIVGFLPSVLLTSLLFGAAHMQWNLAVDTFALSLVLCSLREMTGSIWAGVLLHMLKNGVAFYFIFINPTLLNTLGG